MMKNDRILITSATMFIASIIVNYNIDPRDFDIGNYGITELGFQVVQTIILVIMALSFYGLIRYGLLEKDKNP